MSKGVMAFVSVLSIILAMSVLSGIGFYSAIGMQYPTNANEDVQSAADSFIGQEATDRSGGSVLQDFTTSAATTLSSGWQIIANLSGVLQLLLLLPPIFADKVQLFFQLGFSLTFAFFIRGILL